MVESYRTPGTCLFPGILVLLLLLISGCGGGSSVARGPAVVNGQCGPADGEMLTSAPTGSLCRAGRATAVTGSGPWLWNCTGSNGGTTSSCEAYAPSTPQKPGPSAQLFANPYYSCVRNFYVAADGSDSHNGTSSSAPWLTLQHANDAGHFAGDCINVAPGTYDGVSINSGGNLASSSGYVTYRCTTMDACTVNGTAGPNGNSVFWFNTTQPMANYVIIDGFNIAGSNTAYAIGIGLWNGCDNTGCPLTSSHHVWVLNNIIHGSGQAGVNMNDGEYFYVMHNMVYGNANVTCDAQGSGIAFVVLKAFSSYTPTGDDKTNPNSLIGSFVNGPSFFHNAVEWNIIYNNALINCGNAGSPYDTDGNNIIFDTLANEQTGVTNSLTYLNPSLAAFNIVYNAGGAGIHIFYSEYVTVANNTCYNNYLDPYNQGAARACIDTNDSFDDTIINGIAVAIPAAASGACTFGAVPYAQFNSAMLGGPPSGEPADVWSNNITYLAGGHNSCWGAFGEDAPSGENPMFNADTYSCSSNMCATNPSWVNVGSISTGTETMQPNGSNFALQPGSPAIGYGLTETYLPASSVDVGACSSVFTACP